MKCDDVWPFLETGHFWQRRRAARHLKECPNCARAAEKLTRLKQMLSQPESLPLDSRAQWAAVTKAISKTAVSRTPRRRKLLVGSIAAAAFVLLAVTLWIKNSAGPDIHATGPPVPQIADEGSRDLRPIEAIPAAEPKPAQGTALVEESRVHVQEVDVSQEFLRLRQELISTERELRKVADEAKRRQASARLDLILARHQRD